MGERMEPEDADRPDGVPDRVDPDGGPPRDERRPRAVYGVGRDPDARFSLANERTALSWVRTGLGLVAGGVALTSFATFAELPILLDLVAAVACLAGAVLAGYALWSWRTHEIALRTGAPLPGPSALPVLVGGVVVMGLLLTGYALASIFGWHA